MLAIRAFNIMNLQILVSFMFLTHVKFELNEYEMALNWKYKDVVHVTNVKLALPYSNWDLYLLSLVFHLHTNIDKDKLTIQTLTLTSRNYMEDTRHCLGADLVATPTQQRSIVCFSVGGVSGDTGATYRHGLKTVH